MLLTTLSGLEVIVRKLTWLLGKGTASTIIAVPGRASNPSRNSLRELSHLALNEAGYNFCIKVSSHNFESKGVTAGMDSGCIIGARSPQREAV